MGERRRSKRDEHDERSDSLDVAVAEVDEAALPKPSPPLPLPLLASIPLIIAESLCPGVRMVHA